MLEVYLKSRGELVHEFLLVTDEGDPLTAHDKDRNGPSRVLKRLATYAKKAGITRPVGPHLLRHTFAVEYLRRNPGDIYRLQMILGHSTLHMVQKYLHLAERDLQLGHKTGSPAAQLRTQLPEEPQTAMFGEREHLKQDSGHGL